MVKEKDKERERRRGKRENVLIREKKEKEKERLEEEEPTILHRRKYTVSLGLSSISRPISSTRGGSTWIYDPSMV